MKKRIPDQAEQLRRLVENEQNDINENAPVKDASSGAVTAVEPKSQTSGAEKLIPQASKKKKLKKNKQAKFQIENDLVNIELPIKNAQAPAEILTNPLSKSTNSQENTKPSSQPITKKETSQAPPKEKKPQITSAPMIGKIKRLAVEKETRVIAITGGKGGVGKTNVACNLSLAFTRMNKKVLLLDADLSLANVDVLLGMTPRLNLSHVINREKKLHEILVQGAEGLTIVPGGSGVEELSNLPPNQLEELFDSFARITPVPDILLIDTAAGIHPNVIQFLLAADQVIVVTSPEPPSYTDAYALIKTLVKHDANKDIGILVNMAQSPRQALDVVRLLLQMCQQMLHIQLRNMGFIPRDPAVLKAVMRQKPFLLQAPNCPASKSVHNIAATVLQVKSNQDHPGGIKNFLRRLFGSNKQPELKAASST